MSDTQETEQQLNMRLGTMVDELLSKEGFELVVNIIKVPVQVQQGAPPLFMDKPIVGFVKKKSSILVPTASQDTINKAIQQTALAASNGQKMSLVK